MIIIESPMPLEAYPFLKKTPGSYPGDEKRGSII